MKKTFYLSSLLAVALFLGGCGAKEPGLEEKKQQLQALRTQYNDLGKQISELEKDIAKLDTSATVAAPIPVRVANLEEETFRHFVKVQGQVIADDNIIVSPKAPGIVTRVFVSEGQYVNRGQQLAQIDTIIVSKGLQELYTQLDLANTLYEKQQRLWDQKIGTEVQFLQAKTQKEALEKRIATTREQLAQSRVTAPISGVVEQNFIKEGENAMPGMPAFRLVNLSELEFEAAISESYIPFIKQGDQVRLNFPTTGDQLEAKVHSVSQTINPMNRTVDVRVKLPGKMENLKANMVGEIEINDLTHEKMIVIPMEYVQRAAEGSYVMLAERNEAGQATARRALVETGQSYMGKIEIVKGLQKGQRIITEGNEGLGDGQAIEVLENSQQ